MPISTSLSGRLAHDRLRRRLLTGAAAMPLAATGLWSPVAAQAATGDPFEVALRKRLAKDGVGFAAAQIDAHGLQLSTMGVKRRGAAAPIETSTLFELGSITKAFVALLLADGVLKRRFAFDDPVEDSLPDGMRLRDAAGQPLRLIDLATHRSGLPRLPGNISAKELADPYPNYTEARMFAFLREWNPVANRGQHFEYSNLGYGLLSIVLSRRLGLSFDEALRRNVLLPLGLEDMRLNRPLPSGDDLSILGAALGASMQLAPRLAIGHGADLRPAPAWRFDAMAGAVGLIGSISSLGRFMQAALGQFDHPLREAFTMCLQQRTEGEHPLHPFGLAWEMSSMVAANGTRRTLFNHDGATAGFSMSMWLEPDRQRAGAVLSNAFIETRSLALKALDPTITENDFNLMYLAPTELAPLAGKYTRDQQFDVIVSARDGRLWVQEPGRAEIELLPSSPRRFFTRNSPFEFLFDDGNKSQTLTVFNDGKVLPFARQQ